jgi:hypothetical protein
MRAEFEETEASTLISPDAVIRELNRRVQM